MARVIEVHAIQGGTVTGKARGYIHGVRSDDFRIIETKSAISKSNTISGLCEHTGWIPMPDRRRHLILRGLFRESNNFMKNLSLSLGLYSLGFPIPDKLKLPERLDGALQA